MSNTVAVVSSTGKPLMPTRPKKARILLETGRAKIYKYRPVFTIMLLDREDGYTQPIELKVDTGYQNIGISICSEKQEYVNEQMASIRSEFAELTAEVTRFEADVNANFASLRNDFSVFINAVNIQLNLMQKRIDDFADEIDAAIIGVNALTDLKIEQNNEYILDRVAEGIVNVKVLNYFTGELITVQDMFNYLSEFHLENPITYTELAAANITYTAYAALNMTYTELAVKGKSFISP